jgi:predicted AAA+ superfamily ATPase
MILADLIKQRLNKGLRLNLYFWRDKSGHEIDCILEQGSTLIPIEIKSGATLNSDFFTNLTKWNHLAKQSPETSYVVYGGTENQVRAHGNAIGWTHLDSLPILG